MGFWLFMLVADLLIPFTMIIFGRCFLSGGPKEINAVLGYRTTMSMKNKDTWEFAHKYCGKIWYICGLIMLPLTIGCMLLMVGQSEDCTGSFGGILSAVQMIPLIGSVFFTEKALKKYFDKFGNRR